MSKPGGGGERRDSTEKRTVMEDDLQEQEKKGRLYHVAPGWDYDIYGLNLCGNL